MRMSFRQSWLWSSPPRTCSVQTTSARDRSVRGRRAGSAPPTWPSQRWRAGAGSHYAIQQRFCCLHARTRLRGTG